MKYLKQTLVEPKKVTSESLGKNEQHYRIIYLGKTKKFMDKIRIYFYDRPIEVCSPRSLTFLNPEQLREFIEECCYAYLFLKEQRIKPTLNLMPLPIYRMKFLLPDLLESIRDEQLKRWKNGK